MSNHNEAKLERFLQWLQVNGVELRGCKIKYCDESKGFGIFASNQASDAITPMRVLQDPLIGPACQAMFEQGEVDDRFLMVLFLMLEHLRKNSSWKPYLDLLPMNFGNPLWFSDDELLELKGTTIHQATQLQLDSQKMDSVVQYRKNVKILIVDGDPTSLSNTTRILCASRYQVIGAEQANDALDILHEGNDEIDLILTEANLPDMKKFNFMHSLRNISSAPVIFMSANKDEDFKLGCFSEGAELFYLTKPITSNDVKNLWQSAYRYQLAKSRSFGVNGDPSIRIASDDKFVAKNDEGGPVGLKQYERSKRVWTCELHEKFVRACNYLGPDEATPQKLIKCMNVPGLTKGQISSHLQKHRRYLKSKGKGKETRTIENEALHPSNKGMLFPSSTSNLLGDHHGNNLINQTPAAINSGNASGSGTSTELPERVGFESGIDEFDLEMAIEALDEVLPNDKFMDFDELCHYLSIEEGEIDLDN